jgi:hypothetical protein
MKGQVGVKDLGSESGGWEAKARAEVERQRRNCGCEEWRLSVGVGVTKRGRKPWWMIRKDASESRDESVAINESVSAGVDVDESLGMCMDVDTGVGGVRVGTVWV